MKRTAIKVGGYYETKQGFGQCVAAGGCYPWAAQVRITHPFPRGVVWLNAAEFVREITDAETVQLKEPPGGVHER